MRLAREYFSWNRFEREKEEREEGEKNPGDTPVNFRHEAGKRKLEAYRDNSLLLGVQRILRGCHGFCRKLEKG